MCSRALLGGVFRGQPGELLMLRVLAHDEPITSDRPTDVTSSLVRQPLVSGLPADLADHVHADLMATVTATGLPSGSLLIDQAAHDGETSQMAFRWTGGVLATALAARIEVTDVERSIADLMSGW
jgi:hypothetical protein